MRLYVTLGLITVSFSAVFALRCHQCKYEYSSSVECRQNLTKCPLQCGSITIYNNGSTLDIREKNCTDPAVCVTDATHFEQNKMTFNPQCCDTDLCNTEEAPALLRYSNGLICYSCDIFDNDCSKIVMCSGDEDKCFSSGVNIIDMNTKGCASDILCGNNLLNTLGSISGIHKCCEGFLCNRGQSLKQSLLLLLVPLLSLLSL